MASGLDFSEVYVPGSDATRMLFMEPSAASVPLQSPLKYPPGTRFSYSSGTTNLLSLLFTQRVGHSVAYGYARYDAGTGCQWRLCW